MRSLSAECLLVVGLHVLSEWRLIVVTGTEGFDRQESGDCQRVRTGGVRHPATHEVCFWWSGWMAQLLLGGRVVQFHFLANVILTFTFAICYRPSVCRLSVCRLFVTLVHPTQVVELFGNFFHHTIAQGLYFFGAKNRWWGTPLFPWNLRSRWPTPFKTAKFLQISAHSASTVIASEKSSIITYRKSTTRFPTSHRWTVYVTPTSPPKGWHKNAISLFVPVKFNFSR